MEEQKTEKQMGRPPKHTEPYTKTTIELPTRIHEFLKTKHNFSTWVLKAIEEKREREEQPS